MAKERINIRATTIATSDTFGVINLIVDQPQAALKALSQAGMLVKTRRVLAVLIPDQPGGLDKLAQALAEAEINVNNAYGFVLEDGVKAVFVVDVDQLERAEQLVEAEGFTTVGSEILSK